MYGEPMDDALQSLLFGLESLKTEDSFNIIAFDHELALFSPQMNRATSNSIGQAREWAAERCRARGGTDILSPLQQVCCTQASLLMIGYFIEAFPPCFCFHICFSIWHYLSLRFGLHL